MEMVFLLFMEWNFGEIMFFMFLFIRRLKLRIMPIARIRGVTL